MQEPQIISDSVKSSAGRIRPMDSTFMFCGNVPGYDSQIQIRVGLEQSGTVDPLLTPSKAGIME